MTNVMGRSVQRQITLNAAPAFSFSPLHRNCCTVRLWKQIQTNP